MPWGAVPRRLEAFAIAALGWPGIAQATFAPPIDQPLRHRLTEQRIVGATNERFTSERLIRFSRDGDGYVAHVILMGGATPGQGAGAIFSWMMTAFAGRTLVFRLDKQGAVTAIEDQAALWEQLCTTIAATPGQPADRAEKLRALAAQLRAAPKASRQKMLGSIVTGLIAVDADRLAPGNRTVQVPVAGAPAPLPGTERVEISDGRTRIEVAAAGGVTLGSIAGRIDWRQNREIDTATGLVLAERSERRVMLKARPNAPASLSIITASFDKVS